MSVLKKIIKGGGIAQTIDSIADGMDGLVTSEEEKSQLRNELEKLLVSDRSSARDMYTKDSTLQKVFAVSFLVGYFALIAYLMYLAFFGATTEQPEWATNLVFTIFGAMSIKVSTITDFLFGGSKQQEPNIYNKK